MFQKFKTIEDGFSIMRWLAIYSVLVSAAVSSWAVYHGGDLAERASKRTYVVIDGKAVQAILADDEKTLPVEARDHLRNFHRYFFDLGTDEKAIKASIDKSFYLADGSAKVLYDNLLESGYINGLISGNITQSVALDSIWLDMGQEPYAFRCMGIQTLIRQTSVTTRLLVTRGYLRRTGVVRSDNNPHAFIIERLEVEQNKEIKTVPR